MGQSNLALKFLHTFIYKAQYSISYYNMVIFRIVVFGGVLLFLITITYSTCVVCAGLTFITLLFTRIPYFICLSHFCFHYFIYYAMTKKQVWTPRQLPQIHPAIRWTYGILIVLSIVCAALIVGVTSSFGLSLAAEQVVTVYSSVYYNMTMGLTYDIYNYDIIP